MKVFVCIFSLWLNLLKIEKVPMNKIKNFDQVNFNFNFVMKFDVSLMSKKSVFHSFILKVVLCTDFQNNNFVLIST